MKKNLFAVSLLTVTCLYGVLAALIILIFALTGLPVLGGILLSIAILILQFLVGPWLTDLNMRWFYKAKFDQTVPAYLDSFIRRVCDEQDMKYPRIGYIDDGAPNAFTYGRTKNDARVVLTRGIFEMLSEDEVKAVVAHELGHARHYDMLLMTAAQLVPLVLYALYQFCMGDGSKRRSDSNSKGGYYLAVIGVVAYVLYIVCQYIILWLSRTREYYADEFSVRETRNPAALAEALVKIGFGLSAHRSDSVASPNALGISDTKSATAMAVASYDAGGRVSKRSIAAAMRWEMWNPWAVVYQLGSTHPLISRRILAISAMSAEYGQTPYITFDETKPESYADDFALELLICFAPWLAVIVMLIAAFAADNVLIYVLTPAVAAALSLVKFCYTHPAHDYPTDTVEGLLGEVKVSGVRSIPCTLRGTIIGRGNPGCIFDENFVIRDTTGIVMLNYNQPLSVINKLFSLFRLPEYFNKTVTVRGWYRRSPVPYVELLSYEVDGKVKKCFGYGFGLGWRIALLAVSVLLVLAVAL